MTGPGHGSNIFSSVSTQPDDSYAERMLEDMATTFDGKGQIKNWATERGPRNFKASFGKLGFIEKLQARLGTTSSKIRRDAAFDAISKLISRSELANSERLLGDTKTTMERTGKLRGADIAKAIRDFQKNPGR